VLPSPPVRKSARTVSYSLPMLDVKREKCKQSLATAPSTPTGTDLFQPATRSTEHPAFQTVGQAVRPYLYLLCPPGQPFKIKHIASYWTALPIAPAGSSP
jgi:hypothetical protein